MNKAPVTYALLVANILIFGLEMVAGDPLLRSFALWPPGQGFAPWQLLSCAFLHGSVAHLATNMFGLWMFGRDVEDRTGSGRFLVLFLTSVLTASLTQLAFGMVSADPQPTVGASGGLFGVLTAFAIFFPRRVILLIFPPLPLPAPLFVLLYALFELYAGVTGTMNGVAHFAHLGGLLGGLVLGLRWRRRSVWR
ncbi:rhomboid family intramembrane serine protease [Solimonas variicoloris]|uniref:rhomboid family intramembrane serine protease n=1 Tax=Solimonas variicoloris TaxID=254408 RepID=UPI00036B0E38|nr:rhomboid family intramembrane serine protease [Solimonas variicoloris]